MRRNQKVHLDSGRSETVGLLVGLAPTTKRWAMCHPGVSTFDPSWLTPDALQVTCGHCKKTRQYRGALRLLLPEVREVAAVLLDWMVDHPSSHLVFSDPVVFSLGSRWKPSRSSSSTTRSSASAR
jgi:hypothetical protein